MSVNDRSDMDGEENILIASCTGSGRTGETLVALEDPVAQPCETTNSAEHRELPRSPDGDVSSILLSTASRTSVGTARPSHEYHESVGIGGTEGTIEPGETHGFLHAHHHETGSIQSVKPKTKDNRRILLTVWWTELIALTLAIAALIAIVVLMATYNDKQQPEWKHKINLNTLIAILSTLMRACLVVVAEEAISQLKWTFFRQSTQLRHLARFDKASRGPWGSAQLLFRTKKLNTALLGCIVIVTSIGVGPFTQQAVESVPCDRALESAEASIRISRRMQNSNLARFYNTQWDLDMDTKIALLDGLANPNTTRFKMTPECSTGNCIFQSYNGVTHSSVGMCKKCVDITPWLIEVATVINSSSKDVFYWEPGTQRHDIILPDGRGVGGVYELDKILDVSGHAAFPKTEAVPLNGSLLDAFDASFGGIFQASLLNVSIVTLTNNNCGQDRCRNRNFNTSFESLEHPDVVATTCTFFPCVHDYHGFVHNAVFTESVVKETPILQARKPRGRRLPEYMHFHTPCLIDGQLYTTENMSLVPKDKHEFTSSFVGQVNMTFPSECAYRVDGVYAVGFANFIGATLFGNCTTPYRTSFNGDVDDYNVLACEPWYLKSLVNRGNATFTSIDHNMQAIANAITSEMREQGTGVGKSFEDESGLPLSIPIHVKGTVIQTTVCIKFNWMWLGFPLALLALTIILLGISCGKMYFDTLKIPAWKSSILPLLLTGNQIGATAGARDMDKIEKDTDNLVVSLAHLERGWEFVVEGYEDRKKKDS